jgi:toxin ParE1/3/4
MARLVVSAQAELDAAAIVALLTDKAGPQVASRYRRDIEYLFERLIMFPESGVRRPALGQDTRIGIVPPYIVIYDYSGEDVIVLRIVDGRRNITRRLVGQ